MITHFPCGSGSAAGCRTSQNLDTRELDFKTPRFDVSGYVYISYDVHNYKADILDAAVEVTNSSTPFLPAIGMTGISPSPETPPSREYLCQREREEDMTFTYRIYLAIHAYISS